MKTVNTAHFMIICFFFLLWSCENDLDEVKELFDYPDPDVEVVVDPEIIFSDSGIIQARIEGPLMHREVGSGLYGKDIFPNGLRAEIYHKDGSVNSWMRAGYGENQRKSNEILVQDRVLLYNTEGDTLRAEELIWDQDEKILRTEKFVRMTSDGQLIYGFGFRSKEDFSEWEIKAFKGMVEVEENK